MVEETRGTRKADDGKHADEDLRHAGSLPRATLKARLQQMKVSQLKAKAAAAGIDEDARDRCVLPNLR